MLENSLNMQYNLKRSIVRYLLAIFIYNANIFCYHFSINQFNKKCILHNLQDVYLEYYNKHSEFSNDSLGKSLSSKIFNELWINYS